MAKKTKASRAVPVEPVEPVVPRDSVDVVVAGWRETRGDLDVTPVEVVLRLGRVRAVLDQEMEALFAEYGLTSAGFAAMAAIARLAGEEGVTQAQLMRALQLTSGTVSVRIDRLVAEGLATRRTDPDDRRGTRVALTPRGRELFEAAAPAHLDNERRLLSALSADEQRTLGGLLRKLLIEFEGCGPAAAQGAGWLGVDLVPAHVAAAMRRAVGLPEVGGLLVRAVAPSGPAAAAGIASGDVIVWAGDRPVRSAVDLHGALTSAAAGEALEVRVVRGAQEVALSVTPAGVEPEMRGRPREGEHAM